LGGFETQEGNLSCNPFSLNGEEMMTIFEKKEVNLFFKFQICRI
jgi:hypothetical protein